MLLSPFGIMSSVHRSVDVRGVMQPASPELQRLDILRRDAERKILEKLRTHNWSGVIEREFKDWCSEVTAYPNDMSEMALSHTLPDKVEAAYRRGDMREKRRKLMEAWAAYCAKTNTVVPLRRKA
jgi:hypothetical protein